MYLILQNILVKLMSKMRLVSPNWAGESGERKGWAQDTKVLKLSLSINDLQASASALKETLIYLSCRAEAAQNQAESCLRVAELQHKFNSQPDGHLLLEWGID